MVDAGLSLQTGSLGWTALLRGGKAVYPPMPATGLFRLIRQPIYLAFALTLWTVPAWTPDQLVVALTLTGYCLVAPRLKEARFRRVYGAAFEAYAATVPYWLPWPRKRP
jgi:protein-S-isoprenylcysteine O-methyltransferase Ste14